jgi:hypothetical protein
MGTIMVVLTASTIITCSQALNIIHRIQRVVGLTEVQKTEIVQEIRKVIPFCPVTIKKDGK